MHLLLLFTNYVWICKIKKVETVKVLTRTSLTPLNKKVEIWFDFLNY